MDTDDFLMHYGIKGQKWGDRRYQYEDGTLTPEGIKRYRKDAKRIQKAYETSKDKDTGNYQRDIYDAFKSTKLFKESKIKGVNAQYNENLKRKLTEIKNVSKDKNEILFSKKLLAALGGGLKTYDINEAYVSAQQATYFHFLGEGDDYLSAYFKAAGIADKFRGILKDDIEKDKEFHKKESERAKNMVGSLLGEFGNQKVNIIKVDLKTKKQVDTFLKDQIADYITDPYYNT